MIKIMVVLLLSAGVAVAESVQRVEPSKAPFTRSFTAKRGKLILKFEVPGEPMAEPARVTVTGECAGQAKNPEGLISGLCRLKAYSFDDDEGFLRLETMIGRVDEVGRVTCDVPEERTMLMPTSEARTRLSELAQRLDALGRSL